MGLFSNISFFFAHLVQYHMVASRACATLTSAWHAFITSLVGILVECLFVCFFQQDNIRPHTANNFSKSIIDALSFHRSNLPRFEKLSFISDKPNNMDPRAIVDFNRKYNAPYQVNPFPNKPINFQ